MKALNRRHSRINVVKIRGRVEAVGFKAGNSTGAFGDQGAKGF